MKEIVQKNGESGEVDIFKDSNEIELLIEVLSSIEFENLEIKNKYQKFRGHSISETAVFYTMNPILGIKKFGSIGMPLPNVEFKIVDVNDFTKIVPLGELGEIMIKSPSVMKGYWNKPEETAKVLKDGWIFTGDIGKMDEDGYVYIVDKKRYQ